MRSLHLLVSLALAFGVACGGSEVAPGESEAGSDRTALMETNPNPKPGPEPGPGPSPTPQCVKCGRDADRNFICVSASTGGTKCDITNDSSGRSCSYQLNCGTGIGFAGFAVAFQARVNDHFHRDVIPSARACWRDLQGDGELVLLHQFERGDVGEWVATSVDVVESNLADEETERARQCMSDAARGTGFAHRQGDASEGPMALYWTWPVPDRDY
jgi:hypothetical protein